MFGDHGSYWLGIDKDILLLEFTGSWNAQGTQNCIESFYKAADSFGDRPFGLLFDTQGISGYTKDSFDAWIGSLEPMKTKRVRAMARRDDINSDYYRIFIAKYDKIISQLVPLNIYLEMDECLDFLHSKGLKGFEEGKNNIKPFAEYA